MSATAGGLDAYVGAEHDRVWRRLVAPSDYRNPTPKERYHLAVIGAGPAGLVTAIVAAGLGAHVALIERTALGGDCLNLGCVPSKALLDRARRPGTSFEDAFEWLRAVRARLAAHDSVERYVAAGVDVFLGAAQFIDERTLQCGDARLRARRIVIATGARPHLPDINGLADSRPLTNETVFDLRHRPTRLAIVGAGAIGCELAQGFARLGVGIDLIESARQVLPAGPDTASHAVTAALARDGIRIHLGANIERVERGSSGVKLQIGAERVTADDLVVATGREPNTDDLNLTAAGVNLDASGRIVVDNYLRTTNHRIFAAGDVCSALQYTHNADAHARICVQNALFFPSAKTSRLAIPRCIYTDPEVAIVGLTRDELGATATPFDAHRIEFGTLDRGATQADLDGLAEVLTARGRDTILGATLIGRDAAEQLAPIAVAMTHGLGLGSFSRVVLPYPTRSEYLKRLADGYHRRRFTPFARRLASAWLRWRI